MVRPEVVRLDELPSPKIAAGQARVRVHAAALNFPDVLIVADRYQLSVSTPFVPGSERRRGRGGGGRRRRLRAGRPGLRDRPRGRVRRGGRILGFQLRDFALHAPEELRRNEAELLGLLAEGRVSPHIGATFPLADAAAALRYVADGKAIGKVVIDLSI